MTGIPGGDGDRNLWLAQSVVVLKLTCGKSSANFSSSLPMPDPILSWLLPAAKEAYENREAIQGVWDKLLTLLVGRKQSIAFTGLAGVGKTVLFDHMTGVGYRPGYTPPGTSQSKEEGKLTRPKKRLRLTVVPGQESPPRFEATDDLFGEHPVDGVIHIVANGFVDIREATARDALVGEGISTIDAFREYQLAQELADLDDTCELIRGSLRKNDKPKWMLVVVDKVDLFYEDIARVQSYYSPGTAGAFSRRLQELQSQVGKDNFDWAAVPACAWLQDFTWNGEVSPSRLKPYERDYYIAQLLRLVEAFSAR